MIILKLGRKNTTYQEFFFSTKSTVLDSWLISRQEFRSQKKGSEDEEGQCVWGSLWDLRAQLFFSDKEEYNFVM